MSGRTYALPIKRHKTALQSTISYIHWMEPVLFSTVTNSFQVGAFIQQESVCDFSNRITVPAGSIKHFQYIARRLYRIFAHAWFHHRTVFIDAEASLRNLQICFYVCVERDTFVQAVPALFHSI